MDAKTAITLQQKARKNARNGISGGCGGGATNVNDMRYSCQGFMGRTVRRKRRPARRPRAACPRPANCTFWDPFNCECRDDIPGFMGGVFPCAEDGPCQPYHCLPCDFECGDQECPTPDAIAGGIAPYAECGPCQFTHCIGCGTPIAGYAGGPFPPTCDYCAPCVFPSTCTPCEGPQRQQRWGNQYTPDDFGGRMCFRPCPPNPCLDEDIPPLVPPVNKKRPKRVPKVPPVDKIPPERVPKKPPTKKPTCPPGWFRPQGSNFCTPGTLTTPEPNCPPDTLCCVVLAGDHLIFMCEDTFHPWHGKDVTEYGECYGANGNSICAFHWTDECGEHFLEFPLCIPDKQPPIIQSFPSDKHPTVPTGPQDITNRPTDMILQSIPSYQPEPGKPSPTPRASLAFAGRVRTPSSGVGRR